MASRIKKRVADRKAQEQREREAAEAVAASTSASASAAAPPVSEDTLENTAQNVPPASSSSAGASNDESSVLHVSPVGMRSGGRSGEEDTLHVLPSFSGDEDGQRGSAGDGAGATSNAAPDHLIGMTDDNDNYNNEEDDESPVERAIREARRSVTAGTDGAAVERAIREAQKQTKAQVQLQRPSDAYVSDDDDDDGGGGDDTDDALRKVYGEGGGTAAAGGDDGDSQGSAPSSDPDDGDALEQIIAESDDEDDDEKEEGGNSDGGNNDTTSDNQDFISKASDALLAEVESAVEDGGFDDAGWRMTASAAGSGGAAAAAAAADDPPPPQSGTPRQAQHLHRIRSRKNSAGDAAGPAIPPVPPKIQSNKTGAAGTAASQPNNTNEAHSGMLPEVLTTMRQKIESLTLFDSDMIGLAQMGTGGGGVGSTGGDSLTAAYYDSEEAKAELRRSFQQSISAAVLVSLAHKRYERRRLAAMEIEKVVRGLVQQGELDRVRAILLLLSDDYVRSTSEDARKGGVVALAASAIGLKKADETAPEVIELRDIILASVVHACQDHSQRVRYYATESLFNVVKVLPSLAVQHFFILFEILRSLYADVDLDVRSGAELLDKKLKEVIIGAINAGNFSADACVPLFARFVHMKNKPTKRLTLTWLHEFVSQLLGAPILEFLHLFLSDVFGMVADPNQSIRDLALSFLQSVLPKLLENNEDFEDGSSARVDFDKILQSLVTTMEHPDPFVRKVAMLWMTRIIDAHIGDPSQDENELFGQEGRGSGEAGDSGGAAPRSTQNLTAASISVRNALPHVLPGILLSIGDTYQSRQGTSGKDPFPPEQTTRSLAEQTNAALQDAVRRDGAAYVPHLDGFIYALHEELDTGMAGRNPPAVERRPYRLDVKPDGSGIESTGWFRASTGTYDDRDDAIMISRLCALEWIIVLYEYVVPDSLKAEYACEFINPIIHQLVYEPPESIVFKSFEVLAKITVPVEGEEVTVSSKKKEVEEVVDGPDVNFDPMSESSAAFALEILDSSQRNCKSRDRQVFAQLIHLHSLNHHLLSKLSTVIEYMCTLQPPEFVFVSLALELNQYVTQRVERRQNTIAKASAASDERAIRRENGAFARDIEFVSSFVQQMNNVLLNSAEATQLRERLKNCIGLERKGGKCKRRARLFHILISAFAHNLVATLSLCIWSGAYLTASTLLHQTDPLDLNLICYLEVDEFIELLERPLFRHLHLLMLECDEEEGQEGSGAMLFHTLRSLLMLIPQSTSYTVLKDRLLTVSRFRQSAIHMSQRISTNIEGTQTEVFVRQIKQTRTLHCDSRWRMVRAESLESVDVDIVDALVPSQDDVDGEAKKRRDLLGYKSEEDEIATQKRIRQYLNPRVHRVGEEGKYDEFVTLEGSDMLNTTGLREKQDEVTCTGQELEEEKIAEEGTDEQQQQQWKEYWSRPNDGEASSGD